MLEHFYQKTQPEIATLLRDFLDTHFYSEFPALKNSVIVIAIGSIGNGTYDEYSDIDLKIIFQSREIADEYKDKIKEHKQRLLKIMPVVQLHTSNVLEDIEDVLSAYKDDNLMREMSQALVVEDVNNIFKLLQEKYDHYPENILKEKLQWLFAEIVLEIDRYKIAEKRNDAYFCEVIKLQVIKLTCTTLLMLNNKFPSFDKHLYRNISDIKTIPSEFLTTINNLLQENNISKNSALINQLRLITEDELTRKSIITKQSDKYWIDFRTNYNVTF